MTSGWLASIPKIAIARELLCGEVGECSHVNVSILGHAPTFYLESFQCKQKCMLQGSNSPPKLSVLLSMCPGRRQPIFFSVSHLHGYLKAHLPGFSSARTQFVSVFSLIEIYMQCEMYQSLVYIC